MYIDTNREQSSYQDDHFVSVNPGYIKSQIAELKEERKYFRQCGTWNWTREHDFRNQVLDLMSNL